ncbi:circularly permuted type 2 ATP-grasp protein [Aquincola tertiaricarbonis]|uniref:Circularly permuted type 2 ATP-grasp protein n=1 Tax=Aquincola tertiaricarbonis TaxID=391953 RepID=A0ABY4SD06_AQUTE|nr:circularly permuted type 2 ATP-grasp protein [Aquincola tertiaricarbonis]URI09119.1 circularly permuted type 2 ATP-grasp protein [Aquincola tertiaricarbonis]
MPSDPAPTPPLGLLAQLDLPDPDSFDELRNPDGHLRPAWRRFFDWLPADETPAGFDKRLELIAQQIKVDGVTHNIHGADGTAARPWSLELLPMLIEPADWAVIERGVSQRALLLDTMMADVYGEQKLLRESLLPPSLLYRHPGYLRPLHGVRPPGGVHLHIAAFDLARGADGHWWVISQRTQGPSGLGYVLHNRLIISRLFPEAFREMRVQHIASSYRRLLDTVEAQARHIAGGSPRVVLLTSGPYNETYFEHAYLARYLGVPLVEGGDLTVRADRLYLRTVAGLEPVHGVLRRLDDDYCDPLELRPDSTLGIPGLLQAVRAGHVVVANALGSGFLESPAVQGFLPAISRRLLGQELAMPSLPSWWCGEAAAFKAVLPSLAERVLRPAFPHPERGRATVPGEAGVADWVRRIQDDPDAWLAQGRLMLSRTPMWRDGKPSAGAAMLRVYAIADTERRWHVLPGGMTRVATRSPLSVSMQHGGSSLDTWVLTDGPVDTFSMLPQRLKVDDIATRRRPVSSRTAENLFWLGRYTERTEQAVRLARSMLNTMDADLDPPAPVMDALCRLAVYNGLAAYGTPSASRAPQVFERSVLAALASGAAQGKPVQRPAVTSIASHIGALEFSASALRDRLSPEQVNLVRRMGEEFNATFANLDDRLPTVAQAMPALDRLGLQLAAVTGAQTDRMTRDHGWRLLTVGRLIERLAGMAHTLHVLLDLDALRSAVGVDLVLELFDSTLTFRSRYQRHEDLLALVDLLVLDDANPRAFAGTLRRLRTELGKLPGTASAIDALRERLPAEGAGITLDELRDLDDEALRQQLCVLSDRLQQAGTRLSDDVGQRYFAHAEGGDRLRRV